MGLSPARSLTNRHPAVDAARAARDSLFGYMLRHAHRIEDTFEGALVALEAIEFAHKSILIESREGYIV